MLPPSANEISALIPRSQSKDALPMVSRQQQKYGGAMSVVKQGRIESQRMLMERYRRIDGQPEASSADTRPKRANYQMQYYAGGKPVAPEDQQQRQYIPMS
jgi:hypothetical protein